MIIISEFNPIKIRKKLGDYIKDSSRESISEIFVEISKIAKWEYEGYQQKNYRE